MMKHGQILRACKDNSFGEKWNDYETGRYFRASISALILTNEKLYADNQRLIAKLKGLEEDKTINE